MFHTLYSHNLETLQHLQPGLLAYFSANTILSLQAVHPAPLLKSDGNLRPMHEPYVPSDPTIRGYIVYGLGTGDYLYSLLQDKPPDTPVLVIDSMPDVVQILFHNFDFRSVLNHPDLTYLMGPPETLPAQLHAYLSHRRDLLEVEWLVNPWVSELATERQDAFFLQVFQQYQTYLAQAPKQGSDTLAELYQKMVAPMQSAYAHLPMSCKSGCADCCKKGNGFDISIQPLEWASVYTYITQIMPATQRQQLLQSVVNYLAQHAEILAKALHFFDRSLEQMQTEAGNHSFYELTAQLRTDSCPFLGEDDTCGIYSHRPMVCRIFGNSYFVPNQPYTCDKDQELMEKILLDERKKVYLLEGQEPLSTLKALHAYYPYSQFLYAWLFTHLDFETKNWVSTPQLNYHQFQVLVEHPERLALQIRALKNWAESLA